MEGAARVLTAPVDTAHCCLGKPSPARLSSAHRRARSFLRATSRTGLQGHGGHWSVPGRCVGSRVACVRLGKTGKSAKVTEFTEAQGAASVLLPGGRPAALPQR